MSFEESTDDVITCIAEFSTYSALLMLYMTNKRVNQIYKIKKMLLAYRTLYKVSIEYPFAGENYYNVTISDITQPLMSLPPNEWSGLKKEISCIKTIMNVTSHNNLQCIRYTTNIVPHDMAIIRAYMSGQIEYRFTIDRSLLIYLINHAINICKDMQVM